jgi:hypothetical protein
MRTLTLTAAALLVFAACGQKQAVSPPVAAPAVEVAPAALAEIAAKMVGAWRSTDDAKSTIEVTADGVWISSYVTSPPVRDVSAWRLFTSADAPAEAANYTLEPGKAYLEVKAPDATLHYEIGDVSADSLELFYLARGNRRAFHRMS